MTNPPTLAQVIAYIESRNFKGAMRYEPAWNVPPAIARKASVANHCNFQTATQLCKFSYGLYQIMGSNLYEMDMHVSLGDFLADTTIQTQMFDEFLKDRHIDYSLNDVISDPAIGHDFALHYNGNPLLYLPAIKSASEILSNA